MAARRREPGSFLTLLSDDDRALLQHGGVRRVDRDLLDVSP